MRVLKPWLLNSYTCVGSEGLRWVNERGKGELLTSRTSL